MGRGDLIVSHDLQIETVILTFDTVSRKSHILQGWGEKERKCYVSLKILLRPLADTNESSRIAYCFMRACIHKVRWLSVKNRVPSGRGEFKPMEIPPATLEVGSSLRKLGEEATIISYHILFSSSIVQDL